MLFQMEDTVEEKERAAFLSIMAEVRSLLAVVKICI